MKKILLPLLCAVLLLSLLAGCTVEPPQEPARTPPSSDDAPTPPAQQPPEEQPDILPVETLNFTLYLPNDNADGFDTRTATIAATPQSIVDALAEHGALPAGITVNRFVLSDNGVTQQEGDMVSHTVGDIRHIELDVSQKFLEALQSTGTAGEQMYLGSLVNTLLTAYDAKTISVTCDGETIQTGHAIYDEPLEFQEPS